MGSGAADNLVMPLAQSSQERRSYYRRFTYRKEIDGLRAVAVLAVLINHINPSILPNGHLGVDVFFVISGCVVTSSLASRQDEFWSRFLGAFYWRRWRRLWPALALMVVGVTCFFALFGSPIDDLYVNVFRTGFSALFGFSNLYLLRQGSTYFGLDDQFNPFLHTWSLGVEEQFYLLWPLLMLACGFGLGRARADSYRRLVRMSMLVFVVSLIGYLVLVQRGQSMAAFFLSPFRLWELALGSLAFVVYRRSRRDHPLVIRVAGIRISLGVLILAILILVLAATPLSEAPSTVAIAGLTAALLVVIRSQAGVGRLLGHPYAAAIGLASYSLYLWHWPILVLARFTFGLGLAQIFPLLLLIGVVTVASYRFEFWFRFRFQPLVAPAAFPLALVSMLAVSAGIWLLQGPAKGFAFLGKKTGDLDVATANKLIPGTTISSAMCFLDPTSPVPPSSYFSSICRSMDHSVRRPTLYFEGDSHAHALFILGHEFLKQGRFAVSFATRGGCPFPFFSPSGKAGYRGERYRQCQPHFESRLRELAEVLMPGDVVISESAISNYLVRLSTVDRDSALESYAVALRRLDALVDSRGAQLVLVAPTPDFPQSKIQIPLSLCRPEWFRPAWALPADCQSVTQSRLSQLAKTRQIRELQQSVAAASTSMAVFDPLPALCPPQRPQCSNVEGGQILYSDGSHLTNAGALLLRDDFLAFLNRLPSPKRSAQDAPI
jgi:peptidoglycan/LPS O-acetylase OafA/YrhL